jgi:hypothetical protein
MLCWALEWVIVKRDLTPFYEVIARYNPAALA